MPSKKAEDWEKITSSQCYQFLCNYWDRTELESGIEKPIEFIRKEVNPYLVNLRKKGANKPLVLIKKTKPPYFVLSSEEK